jgi:hypothetical protein
MSYPVQCDGYHHWRTAPDGLVSCLICGKIAEAWIPEDPSVLVLKCECGAASVGIKPFAHGHSDFCPIADPFS